MHADHLTIDSVFALIGVTVAVWSMVMSFWKLNASSRQEATILAALGVTAVLLYRERRSERARNGEVS